MPIPGDSQSQELPLCENCPSGDSAALRCVECGVFMCEVCVTAHQRVRAIGAHRLMTPQEVREGGPQALHRPTTCAQHEGEILKMFCETCDEPICRDCAIIDHRDHKYKFIRDAFPVEKEKITKAVRETEFYVPVLKRAIEAAEKEVQETRDNFAEVSKEVNSFINEVIANCERRRDSLKLDLENLTSKKLKELNTAKESASSTLRCVESNIQIVKQTIGRANEVETLSAKNQMIDQLAAVRSTAAVYNTCDFVHGSRRVPKVLTVVFRQSFDSKAIDEMVRIGEPHENYILSMVGGELGVLYTTRATQTCNFILSPKHVPSTNRRNYIIKVEISRGFVVSESPLVDDNEDGTYTFMFRPDNKKTADYSIRIVINGKHIEGSPFTLQVKKPSFKFFRKIGMKRENFDEWKFTKGHHCWKLKLLFPELNEPQQWQPCHCIGVNEGLGPYRNQSYWKKGKHVAVKVPDFLSLEYTTSTESESSIDAFQSGDVFVCYLNMEKGKLTIFNERTKQSDTWTKLQAPVSPFVYPDNYSEYCQYFKTSNI